jgi:hypothetical protein
VVQDKLAFVDYMIDQRALDMLQFRVCDSAIFLREDAGLVVPGVAKQTVYDLYDRKT